MDRDPDEQEDDAGDPELRGRVSDARPELDPIVRAVIRANAAAALFGRPPDPVLVGRYELVREVGTGGGGSVFVARDPELDRDIALKLIAAPDPALRARALAEGQTLARLSHPNIVPVFDVGVVDDRVYLVMELIRGESLRVYAAEHPVRDVIRAYRQAGDGLVAAHAAGLVHRDFKPDNAVIGSDGRVRVVDFGLAGAEGAAGIGGTPRYMAPEQREGAAATPAVDQYAFAAALGEAVARAGGGTGPRWLEPIVRRGTSYASVARYPSLAALLRALANDPRTRWRRRSLVATPVALASIGFAIGRGGGDDVKPCDDGSGALAPAWTPARLAAAHDHVTDLATAFATSAAPRVRAALAGYAGDWMKGHHAACIAARTEPSATVIDRRAACLASARNQLGAAIDVAIAVDADGLPAAMLAISELPDLARCADSAALVNDIPLPAPGDAARVAAIAAAIDRAQVRADAALPDAADAAAATVADARSLGYRPLLAVALLAHGRALDALNRQQDAVGPLSEAVDLAIPVRDDATAVEAYARMMLGKAESEYAVVIAGMRPILGLAERLGAHDRFAVALLHNHAGVLENAAGHVDRARTEWTMALDLARRVTDPGAVELAWVRSNLALIASDPAERRQLLDEAVAVARDRLGPDHPLSLDMRIASAFGIEAIGEARAALRPVCTRYAALHPGHPARIIPCAYELAMLDVADADPAAARASLALAIDAAPAPDAAPDLDMQRRLAIAHAYAALLDGDAAPARAQLDRLAVELAPGADAGWWELLFPADVELGRAAAGAKDAGAAIERAIHLLETAARTSSSLIVTRRLVWARRVQAAHGGGK